MACSANDVSSGTSPGSNGAARRSPQRDQHADHRRRGRRAGRRRSIRTPGDPVPSADLPADPASTAVRLSTTSRRSGSRPVETAAGRARPVRLGADDEVAVGRGRAPAPGASRPTSVSSSVRWAISPSASSSLAPDSSSFRISADASSHCCRSLPCSNRSALCTAIPAAAARASTRTSSSRGELPAAVLLGQVQVAEHRVARPGRAPRGRCASAGGAAGSRPTPSCLLRSASRSGRGPRMSWPSRPLPSGRRPIFGPGRLVQARRG